MNESKRKKLEAAGWATGSTAEFLELSEAEAAIVELRVALGIVIRTVRTKRGITQADLAARIKSSQSRVAKMEAADPEVSIELQLRGLIAAGATRREMAAAFGTLTARKARPRAKAAS